MKHSLLIAILLATACSTLKATPPDTSTAASTVLCSEHPLPEFALGSDRISNEAGVCECIWSNLSEQDREVATNLRNGLSPKAALMKSFPTRFGKAIGSCTSASN